MTIPAEKPDTDPREFKPAQDEEMEERNDFGDPIIDDEEEEDEDEVEEEEEEDDDEVEMHPRRPIPGARFDTARLKTEQLLSRLRSAPVPVRVHEVIIKGNKKTKDHVIEAEVEFLKQVKTMQDLLEASRIANIYLQALDIFDSVNITLDSGPSALPGSANVIVDVVETKRPLSGQLGAMNKSEDRSSSLEGSLIYKNLFGYGDLWDGSLAFGLDHTSQISFGLYLPRFRGRHTPFTSRAYILSQDLSKFSSYEKLSRGLSLGLYSSGNHDLAYTMAWRTLTDPSQMASRSVRRQLGHNLLSSLKYTFKLDERNSSTRPIKGYAFQSTTQVGGLAPDSRSLRFLRQEIDLRYAVPLGFYRAALNFGISGGITFPWGNGYLNKSSPITERFFLGGQLSPVSSLGGPAALWGFKTRGLGPTEPRRQNHDEDADSSARDFLGGDLAVTAFADFSFDLPSRWFREKGIHGHVFACAGNLAKLTENEYKNFNVPKFVDSFRSSIGVGIVVPSNIFRLEVNYCHILKKDEYDRAKSGFFVTFTPTS